MMTLPQFRISRRWFMMLASASTRTLPSTGAGLCSCQSGQPCGSRTAQMAVPSMMMLALRAARLTSRLLKQSTAVSDDASAPMTTRFQSLSRLPRLSTTRWVEASRSMASTIGTIPARTSMPSSHSISSPIWRPAWPPAPSGSTSVTTLAAFTPMPIGSVSEAVNCLPLRSCLLAISRALSFSTFMFSSAIRAFSSTLAPGNLSFLPAELKSS
mmetsp:Transcript_5144/g.10080  ORF Transcript_5144/g.10080 Transcript_5144/m.10080 type:complete len:213 (+) Transcript_5144:154-792(+)